MVSREGLNEQRVQEQIQSQAELYENQKFIQAGQQIKVDQIEVNAEEEQKPAVIGYT